MRIAVYPGTFDPITLGHMSVVQRSQTLFDELIVLIAINPNKIPMFTETERVEMTTRVLKHFRNVRVSSTKGLVVRFAQAHGARFLIRGVRSVTDMESEIDLAQVNYALAPDVETVFVAARPDLAMVSSSRLKELVTQGKDISQYCAPGIEIPLKQRAKTRLEGSYVEV